MELVALNENNFPDFGGMSLTIKTSLEDTADDLKFRINELNTALAPECLSIRLPNVEVMGKVRRYMIAYR